MTSSVTYIHNHRPGINVRILQFIMRITGMKRSLERVMGKKNFSSRPYPVPKSLNNGFICSAEVKNGREGWTFRPKTNGSGKTVMYLHGGAYVLNILKYHWSLIEELMTRTGATFIVPDYPLAPAATYTIAYDFVDQIYEDLLAGNSAGDIILMGDSAGGGLALGFTQKLRNENRPLPAQVILLSPWLDVTMGNPGLSETDKKDTVLGIKGLKMAGEAYAGETDTGDYRVSPLNGNLKGLGKISVFTGTHDLLLADARKFKMIMDNSHIPFNYFEYPGMFHDWIIITSLKESQHAAEQVASLINT